MKTGREQFRARQDAVHRAAMAPKPISIRRAPLLAAARSRLARLQATIEQKALKAPFSGVIGISRIDVGQYLQPGTVIASFQDLDSMKVDFTVPEQVASQVKLGQRGPRRRQRDQSSLHGQGDRQGPAGRSQDAARLRSGARRGQQGRAVLPGQFLHVEVVLPAGAECRDGAADRRHRQPLRRLRLYHRRRRSRAGAKVLVTKQVFVKTGRRRGGAIEVRVGHRSPASRWSRRGRTSCRPARRSRSTTAST